MSRLASILGLLPRTPTVLRTLRHVRPVQARAQLEHMVFGLRGPRRLGGDPPVLATPRAHTTFLAPPEHVGVVESGGSETVVELLAIPFGLHGSLDWQAQPHGPLFAYHLHQQEYLRHASFPVAARSGVLRDWIERHAEGVGWDPHPISLRLLCWGKLLLSEGALEDDARLRDAMFRSMADQAETLAQGTEVRLQANHLLSNLLTVVWSGVLFEGALADRWLAHSEVLIAELDRQIHPDGGHEERSPMYHSLILENVLDLLNLSLAGDRAPQELVEALRETASRMLVALDVYTQPDGRIALLADSALGIAPEPAVLVDYASRLGIAGPARAERESACLPQTGYLRLRAGAFDLIASVAGPAPAHQPGHAHCDALSFELCVGGRRLVTDTGLLEYRPGASRDSARATASHATLQIDGREQAEIWAAHRIGGRPEVELLAWDEAGSAEAHCRGWSRGAPDHRRSFRVSEGGVEIVDRVEGRCSEVVSRWPLGSGWQVELVEGRARVSTTGEPNGSVAVEIDLPGELEWRIERGPEFRTLHRAGERDVLVGRANGLCEVTTRFRLLD